MNRFFFAPFSFLLIVIKVGMLLYLRPDPKTLVIIILFGILLCINTWVYYMELLRRFGDWS